MTSGQDVWLLRNVSESTSILKTVLVKRWKVLVMCGGAVAFVYCSWKCLEYGIKEYNARLFNEFATKGKGVYVEHKEKLFESLQKPKSTDDQVQDLKQITLLEIGVGAGANLDYYPDGTHLIVVDPNPHFKTYFNEARMNYPKIKSGEIIIAKGENMKIIASDTMDVVVLTLTLCSVDDVKAVIDEIYRVLVPDGKFFFMEHVKEWDGRNKSRIRRQIWYDRLGFWSLMLDGCKLTRNPLPCIQEAGFTRVDFERFYAKIADVASPHVMGVAVK